MTFYCQHCGMGLPPGSRFCSGCGAAIAGTAPHVSMPLVRPLVGRQIAGVCLAVARSNGWDVTAVRVLTVIAFLFSSGLIGIAYLAGWIGIPEEPLPMPAAWSAPGAPPQQQG